MEAMSGVYLLGLSFTILVNCVAANTCDPNPCPNRLACSPIFKHTIRCGAGYIEETSNEGDVKKSLKNPLGVDGYVSGIWYNSTGSIVDGIMPTDMVLGRLDLTKDLFAYTSGYSIDKTNGNLIINKVEKHHDGIYMVAMNQPEPGALFMYGFIRLHVPGAETATGPETTTRPNNGGNDIKLCAELIVAYLIFTVFAHCK